MVAGPPNAGKSSLVNLLSAWEALPSVGGGARVGGGAGTWGAVQVWRRSQEDENAV